jgi:hypothetical protein
VKPADQGFDAGRDIVPRVDDRLIINVDFAPFERVPQILLEDSSVTRSLQKVAGEEADAAAPIPLSSVECEVGIPDQVVAGRTSPGLRAIPIDAPIVQRLPSRE